MLQFAATKSVNLECEFEEFTTNIPLYRVIISALHLVKNTPQSKLTQTWNLQRDAHSLLSHLAHIPPLHPKIALNTARTIRLNLLERKRWKGPLELAVAVLEQKSVILDENPQEKRVCMAHQHRDRHLGTSLAQLSEVRPDPTQR